MTLNDQDPFVVSQRQASSSSLSSSYPPSTSTSKPSPQHHSHSHSSSHPSQQRSNSISPSRPSQQQAPPAPQAEQQQQQVGARQATRTRTRTRRTIQTSNTTNNHPRYNSEDHPLSDRKLSQRGYHSFQCLGVPFHVNKRYTYLRELGIGAYGCVALARDNLLDCNVAIKKVTRVFERDVLSRRALREVAVLRTLAECDNVTSLLDFDTSFIDFSEIYLFLAASEADLSQIIRSGQTLSDAHLQYFVAQILRGVRYMHSANILHRDLKPGNLLVNADCALRLCDFGLARGFADPMEEEDQDSSNGTETGMGSQDATNGRQGDSRDGAQTPPASSHPSPQLGSENLHTLASPSSPLSAPKRPSHISTSRLEFPGGPLTEYVATRWYRAPEVMLCFREGYGKESDMWSVGCILAELIEGKPIFAGKDYVDQIARINNVLGCPSEATLDKIGSDRAKTYVQSLPRMPPVPFSKLYPRASPEAVDLLSKLLTWDPSQRVSAEQALQHPWLKAYHESNARWQPPAPFDKFQEVEMISSMNEFKVAMEREADEMKRELAALEQEQDALTAEIEEDNDQGDEVEMGFEGAGATDTGVVHLGKKIQRSRDHSLEESQDGEEDEEEMEERLVDSGASANGASSSSSCGASTRSRMHPLSADSSLTSPTSAATSEYYPGSPPLKSFTPTSKGVESFPSRSFGERKISRPVSAFVGDSEISLGFPTCSSNSKDDQYGHFTPTGTIRKSTYRRRAVSNAYWSTLDSRAQDEELDGLGVGLQLKFNHRVSSPPLPYRNDGALTHGYDTFSPYFKKHGTDIIARPRAENFDGEFRTSVDLTATTATARSPNGSFGHGQTSPLRRHHNGLKERDSSDSTVSGHAQES